MPTLPVVTQTAEPGAPWWKTGVVYHVYLRSFQDGDGDGVGDFAGLTARLDYVAELGVDAVWVSPFYPSPMRDFGYDVADLCGVDPRFGALASFDAFLEAAHRRGLRVVIDWIPNHTSSDHPWFAESRADRANAKRSWYVWRDPAPGGGPPNNWLSAFGGPAWTLDARTGQYYLHLCLPEMPDLNLHVPGVEAALFGAARFWLDRGVDGFRVDVAHWIGKDAALRDNPADREAPAFENLAKPPSAFDRMAHVFDMDGPLGHAVYRRFRALLDGYAPARAALGEIHLAGPRWAAYFGAPEAPELHLPVNFGLLGVPFEAGPVRAAVDRLEALVPAHGWPTYVLSNHDEPRLASRVGPDRARLAALLLLTLRGTPTLYYGDELGLESLVLPPGEPPRDPLGLRVRGHGRDAGRAPMPWSSAPNAGFCPDDVAPWLPLSADAPGKSVDAQRADPASLLALYRRLLALRRARPALHAGTYAPLDRTPEHVFAFTRTDGADRVLVALNFGDASAQLALPAPARMLLSTDNGARLVGRTLHLPPRAGAVLDP